MQLAGRPRQPDRFSEYIERVSQHHERVVVTKNGREAAVLVSVDDLASLEETIEILGDSQVVAQLLAASRERRCGSWRRRSASAIELTVEQDELVVTHSAARSLRENLPESIAAAVIELITGPLVENPHRVGEQLRNELGGYWSARRGTYRVVYQIKDEPREVVVTFI